MRARSSSRSIGLLTNYHPWATSRTPLLQLLQLQPMTKESTPSNPLPHSIQNAVDSPSSSETSNAHPTRTAVPLSTVQVAVAGVGRTVSWSMRMQTPGLGMELGMWDVVRRDRSVRGLLGGVQRGIRLVRGRWGVGVVFRDMSVFGVVVRSLPFSLLSLSSWRCEVLTMLTRYPCVYRDGNGAFECDGVYLDSYSSPGIYLHHQHHQHRIHRRSRTPRPTHQSLDSHYRQRKR